MRPPPRSTRSSNSPISPTADSRPKPTIADVAIAPRRRMRDGSTSSRGRSSRGNSVASSASSRASSANRATTVPAGSGSILDNIRTGGRGRGNMADNAERRRSLTSTVSVFSESDGGSYMPSTNGHSTANSRDSSLSPPPPEASSTTTRQRRPVASHQSILDVMDEYQNQTQSETIPSLPIVNNPNTRSRNDTSSSSSSSSSSDSNGGRRYTAHEKGKGRAVVTTTTTPIEIESSSEEPEELKRKNSIQFIDIHPKKRRRKSDEDMIDELISNSSDEGEQGVDGEEEEVGEEDTLAGGYTCPVCFCPPSQAVMTPCGHILCAQCLHSSLLAAIGRNPNPYPDLTLNRPNGRHPSRGRNNHTHKHPEKTVSFHGKNGGPTKWTKDLLMDFWLYHLNQECEKSLVESEVPRVEWEGIKAVQIPSAEEVKVEQKLRGLWRVEESWVVEGECPVCRNALPGGYGPYGTGIGGIIPLQAKLSSSATTGPKRKRE
ncbi:hypothetical protein I302_101869 [Kwoniella bestiolae CBS 10118]|uniref:RING-type domain-containing protein n=1 Tax=Kwoniella bestiolae CBS 10118 TaxID=1296100 RepID=A0AAJ8K2W0_9TREE